MNSVGYAYVRYSSIAQATGESVDRQISPLKQFTDETGVQIKEVIVDEGVSSYKGRNVNKGKFKEILNRIESGVIRKGDYIVVESIDRITRQRVSDGVELLQGILRKGIRIYTTIDRICYSYDREEDDLTTIVMIALIAKRANEESATKSRRRKDVWNKHKELAIQGIAKINRKKPPYGLAYDSNGSKFVINESEAAEIRKIFSLLKYMGVSNAIRTVNENSKRKWANRHVMHMIDSQYPLGVLRSQKRTKNDKKEFIEYIDGYYPAIVTQAEFNEAVSAMKSRRDRKDYGNTSSEDYNIFRSVIKCGCCGSSLVFEKQKNPKGVFYFYLHCYSRKELKGGCDQRFRFDLAFGMLLLFVGFVLNSNKKIGFRKIRSPSDLGVKSENSQGLESNGFGVVDIDPERFAAVRDSVKSAQGEFVDLFSGATPSDERLNEAFNNARADLEKLEGKYNRIRAAIERGDGEISKLIMDTSLAVEKAMAKKREEIDALAGEVEAAKVSIPVHSYKDVVDMFMTKSGRLELNRFFIAKKIRFEFKYASGVRRLDMRVFKDDVQMFQAPFWFPLHKPLVRFNLPNLAELCGA